MNKTLFIYLWWKRYVKSNITNWISVENGYFFKIKQKGVLLKEAKWKYMLYDKDAEITYFQFWHNEHTIKLACY